MDCRPSSSTRRWRSGSERERTLAGPAAVEPEPDREDWVALPPRQRRRAAGTGRAAGGGRPQPRGAAGAEAAGAAGADAAGRGLLLRRDRRDHRLQPDQNQPLPGRGPGAVPRLVARSEDGSRCAEMRPLLSAFCDGEAKPEEVAELREHLRACARCRATLRTYRAAPAAAAALAPSLPLPRSLWERAQDALGDLFGRVGGGAAASQAAAGRRCRRRRRAGEDRCRLPRSRRRRRGLRRRRRRPGPARSRRRPRPAADRAAAVRGPDRRAAGTARSNPRRRPTPSRSRSPIRNRPPRPQEPTEANPPQPNRRRSKASRSNTSRRRRPNRSPNPLRRPARAAARPGSSARDRRLAAHRSRGVGGARPGGPCGGRRGGRLAGRRPNSNSTPGRCPAPRPARSRPTTSSSTRTGSPVGSVIERPANELIRYLEVPPVPGVYRLEAWLEDAGRNRAPPRRQPTSASTTSPRRRRLPRHRRAGCPAASRALLESGHPAGPLPLSGIRGYAVSLDRGSGGHPCADPSLCSPAETDLAGGIDDDSLSLGTLAEGTTYARVVAVSGAGVPSPVRTATFRVDATAAARLADGDPRRLEQRPGEDRRPRAGPAVGHGGGRRRPGRSPRSRSTAAPRRRRPATRRRPGSSGSGVHTVAPLRPRRRRQRQPTATTATAPPQTAVVRIDEDPPAGRLRRRPGPGRTGADRSAGRDALSGPEPQPGLDRGPPRRDPRPLRGAADPGRRRGGWSPAGTPTPTRPASTSSSPPASTPPATPATGADRAHGGRMVLVNPLKTPVSLTAKLGGRAHRAGACGGSEAARWRSSAIAVVETFAAGAEPQRRTSFRTHRRERRLLAAAGARAEPRRRRLLRRHPDPDAGAPAPSAHLGVGDGRAPARLRRDGEGRRQAGRLQRRGSPPAAPEGRRAACRSNCSSAIPGAGWRGFRTVEADRRGRFRYAYRFSDDDSRGVRFRFRAHVKGREGWPYEPGSSRPVTVTGR